MNSPKPLPRPGIAVWQAHEDQHVCLNRGNIEFVSQFKYLGSMSSAWQSSHAEMSSAFHRLIGLWGDKHISRQVKVSVYEAIVQATLLYGCEAWAAPKALIKPLDVFQMRCLRRICGISLREKKTNSWVRGQCGFEAIKNISRLFQVQEITLAWACGQNG